ncbi:MAG: hypothetical protein ABII68_12110 [Pseudomonadota bacterium]
MCSPWLKSTGILPFREEESPIDNFHINIEWICILSGLSIRPCSASVTLYIDRYITCIPVEEKTGSMLIVMEE